MTKDPSTELFKIIPELRIQVLYTDTHIIVIDKPCNLRSVPGHATPADSPASNVKRKNTERASPVESDDDNLKGIVPGRDGEHESFIQRTGDQVDISCPTTIQEKSEPRRNEVPPKNTMKSITGASNRKKGQEAWTEVIACIPRGDFPYESQSKLPNDEIETQAKAVLQNLSKFNASSIPRKLSPFVRFCKRNRNKLFRNPPSENNNEEELTKVIQEAYRWIKQRQQPLLNLPEATSDDDSALGQLRMMGYEENPDTNPIRAVHRLDCETSGLMVFARNDNAASNLCRAWRQTNGGVQKIYLAKVRRWPPFHEHALKEGRIDIPLASSEERIKWEVREVRLGGKLSQTCWSIASHDNDDDLEVNSLPRMEQSGEVDTDDGKERSVVIRLRPITGRTHQLRIHCATIGSGIEGDSLYGDNPIEWRSKSNDGIGSGNNTLHLHACRLTFPHPENGQILTFSSKQPWK